MYKLSRTIDRIGVYLYLIDSGLNTLSCRMTRDYSLQK